MSIKKAVILGGTILLVVGCNYTTSPTAPAAGGSSAVKTKTNNSGQPTGTRPGTMSTMSADSTGTCFSSYPVTAGYYDTTCPSGNQ